MKKLIKLIAVTCVLLGVVGCSSQTVELDLAALHQGVLDQAEVFMIPASAELEKEEFITLYGVDAAMVEEVVATRAMMSAHLCDILMIKVASGKSQEVLEAIQATYSDAVLYPFMTEYVESMQVIEKGDYLIIVVAEEAQAIGEWIKTEIE
ncbi:MAG: DUF4358 domain-containing protein [Anaerorhabdus sp.]